MDRSKIQGLVNELDDAAIRWATASDEGRATAWARLENARNQVTLALAEPSECCVSGVCDYHNAMNAADA